MGTTTAELLLTRLEDGSEEILTVRRQSYHLRAVLGRSNSVCFTLEQETTDDGPVLLAEGYSFQGELLYDQLQIEEDTVDRILRWLLNTPIIATMPGAVSGITSSEAAADD